MEQINPYAVTRNTATYEAYRAFRRAEWKAGQGLLITGMIVPALWTPFALLAERRFAHEWMGNFPLFAAVMLAPAVICCLLAAIGAWRMMRFRREHPIPDEWRQIPRSGRRQGAA